MQIHFRMMANGILETKTDGNACLDIGAGLSTGCAEGEDVEATHKELLDLIDRHERNIDSPLQVNLENGSEPKVVFIDVKLHRGLKNQMITLLNEFEDVLAWYMKICLVSIRTSWCVVRH